MPKVYLRAVNTTQFEWVDNPERATADSVDSLQVNLKQFKNAEIEEIPSKNPQMPSKWVIRTDK